MFEILILIPFFLCWGSFLNVVAYRLVHEESIVTPRSKCPHCNHSLAWYDLIPVLSFIILRGKCRYCKQPISYLYPLIELLTVVIMTLLVQRIVLNNGMYAPLNLHQGISYFIFFSALIVTIRTDLETMLISRYVTLFLVPLGFLLSHFNYIPLSLNASITGALFGYGILYAIQSVFYWITKKHGMGQGDLDLLAFIGSFTGVSGAWLSLMVGSMFGSVIGLLYMLIARPREPLKMPFGPFLVFGALLFVLYQNELITLVLNARF
jgi:leader peptidase (prepilin peptidase)/N-methyltransferase